MNNEALEYLARSVLCWLATVDDDGTPNVSPKEIFCAHGASRLLIANIASPGSRRNIERHPAVCVSLVDVFVQKGVKLKGRATVVAQGSPDFEALARPLVQKAGDRFPFTSLFSIEVTDVQRIVAPSYARYPDTREADQITSAMRTYGVQPAKPPAEG